MTRWKCVSFEYCTLLVQGKLPFCVFILNNVVFVLQGFYGATLEDLNHELYGYRSLEGLLRAYPNVVKLQDIQGTVMVLPTFTLPHEVTCIAN